MPPKIMLDGRAVAVSKIVCVARNYADHAKEMGTPVPKEPMFFLKPSSALLPGGGTILPPPQSRRVEVETEVAVILGANGQDVRSADAMERVAGYAVFYDITARDLQARAREEVVHRPRRKGSTPSPRFPTRCPPPGSLILTPLTSDSV